jgi:hypothetical protein
MKYMKSIFLSVILLLSGLSATIYSQEKVYTRDDFPKTYKTGDVTKGWEIHKQYIGGDQGWKLKKNKKGIKIYVRKVSISPILSFLGVVELETDLSTVVAFMTDVSQYTSYMQMCNHAEILQHVSVTDKIFYTINRPPWPVKPRDNIALSKWAQDPDTLIVSGKCLSLPEFLPHKKEFIRCPLLLIDFSLRPLDNGNTEFTFEAIVEVGGWVPNWVVNFCLVDTPYTGIMRIRKLMPFDNKYKKQKLQWLKLPPSHQKLREE